MQDLRDKVAVVTGGANGIGLALVRALLGQGMRVAVADVDPAALASVRQELAGDDRVLVHPTDVTSAASVAALADAVYDRFGACHLLCNNAGVGAPSAKVWQTTPNDWAWVFGVNVTGVVNGILTFVPRMLAVGRGGARCQHVVVGRTDLAPAVRVGVRRQQVGGVRALPSAWRPSWRRRARPLGCRSSTLQAGCSGPVCGRRTGPGPRSWPWSGPARPRP